MIQEQLWGQCVGGRILPFAWDLTDDELESVMMGAEIALGRRRFHHDRCSRGWSDRSWSCQGCTWTDRPGCSRGLLTLQMKTLVLQWLGLWWSSCRSMEAEILLSTSWMRMLLWMLLLNSLMKSLKTEHMIQKLQFSSPNCHWLTHSQQSRILPSWWTPPQSSPRSWCCTPGCSPWCCTRAWPRPLWGMTWQQINISS